MNLSLSVLLHGRGFLIPSAPFYALPIWFSKETFQVILVQKKWAQDREYLMLP